MFTKKLTTTLSVITAVLAIIAGIWALEGHYETKAAASEKIENVEIQVAGAFEPLRWGWKGRDHPRRRFSGGSAGVRCFRDFPRRLFPCQNSAVDDTLAGRQAFNREGIR